MNSENNTSSVEAADEDHVRVLRPVHRRDYWPRVVPPGTEVTRLVVLDLETTGICPTRYRAIEFAAAMLCIGPDGRIVAIEGGGSALIDPGHPISREIEQLTGISDDMLAGQGIDAEKTAAFLARGDYVCSYNAQFDRAHLEVLLPDLPPLNWCCAMTDVKWRDLGFETGPQGWLLAQTGHFNPSVHRAASDVQSLCTLLSYELNDGDTIAGRLIEAARAPAWRFEAKCAPFASKDELRELRYTWSARHKRWHKHVRDEDYRRDLALYRAKIGGEPAIVELPATDRYRPDWTWRPS